MNWANVSSNDLERRRLRRKTHLAALLALCVGPALGGFELRQGDSNARAPVDTTLDAAPQMTPHDGPLMRSPNAGEALNGDAHPKQSVKNSGVQYRRVEGFLRRHYVYGEVELLPDGRVEGYVVLGNKKQVLIQGARQPKGRIEALDESGELVQLELVDTTSTEAKQ